MTTAYETLILLVRVADTKLVRRYSVPFVYMIVCVALTVQRSAFLRTVSRQLVSPACLPITTLWICDCCDQVPYLWSVKYIECVKCENSCPSARTAFVSWRGGQRSFASWCVCANSFRSTLARASCFICVILCWLRQSDMLIYSYLTFSYAHCPRALPLNCSYYQCIRC